MLYFFCIKYNKNIKYNKGKVLFCTVVLWAFADSIQDPPNICCFPVYFRDEQINFSLDEII
jgi:hypothetical protein